MSDVLDKICADKRDWVRRRKAKLPLAELEEQAAAAAAPRGFRAALEAKAASGANALICEIKKASPSKGLIRADFDPPSLARAYHAGGAACLSVLTDETYFQGSDAFLAQARAACDLPVLRKDFLIDPWQVHESRLLGADCVLLIVAALSVDRLQELDGLARASGLDVLVEVHEEAELERALSTGAELIGVNNRDLHRFTTDLSTSERLRPLIPAERTMVTESGIHETADVERLQGCGIDAFLVGEALMRAADPGAELRRLFFGGTAP